MVYVNITQSIRSSQLVPDTHNAALTASYPYRTVVINKLLKKVVLFSIIKPLLHRQLKPRYISYAWPAPFLEDELGAQVSG